ncbi:hypothetical protein C8R45DRAFT_932918 [Mycena sanguinolenta]|nr:hypothetical protein C8R45DRAFT_932918 [Mycena sanguinolenta]
MTEHVGKFTQTIRNIHAYFEAQQDGNRIKQLFRNNMNHLVKDCYAELDEAKKIFEVGTSGAVLKDIAEMKKAAQNKHRELLELISTISETNTDSSSIHLGANELKSRQGTSSMPKIFHGRETELEDIMMILIQESPRIAILGGGGMGKTSLARAALHHPDTLIRFEEIFFVSAEPATTSVELAALIGLHVGLDPGQDFTKAVVWYFSNSPACMLVLDNLETVWEPIQSRAGLEEFLSLLADIKHLGLIQTFIDITDNSHSVEEFNQLLSFTDNMPLAVDLLAHLVDYEGLKNVLKRWEKEKTSMLSMGFDRKSNLDASISLSLSSPRVTSESKQLLSLLSILPNGLSDAELVQSKLPISNILSCKTTLLATSLAYHNSNKRLLVLMPVREHVQQFLPPPPPLVQSLCTHFYSLLKLFRQQQSEQMCTVVNQITMNLGNVQEVLQRGLYMHGSNIADTIYCSIFLSYFCRLSGHKMTLSMNEIEHLLPTASDHQLEIDFIIEVLSSDHCSYSRGWMKKFIAQGICCFQHLTDPLLEGKYILSEHNSGLIGSTARFYLAAATFTQDVESDLTHALQFTQRALELSKLSGNNNQQSCSLACFARLKFSSGAYSLARESAREAQHLAELSSDLYSSANALHIQAECSICLGEYQKSLEQLHKSRKILEICGMSAGTLYRGIPFIQASIHRLKSEYVQARGIFSDIAEKTSPNQSAALYGAAILNIAYIDIEIGGAVANVWGNLDKAVQNFKTPKARTEMAVCKLIGACMDLRECKFEVAQTKFHKYLHFPYSEIKSISLEHLANIRAWPTGKCSSWPVIYLSFAYTVKEKLALHKALLFLGDVFITNEDENTAVALYTIALEGFMFMDVHRYQAECMLRLGDLAQKHGNTTEAVVYWKIARPLFEKSSQVKDVAELDSRLASVEKAHEKALVMLANLKAPPQMVNEFPSQNHFVEVALM